MVLLKPGKAFPMAFSQCPRAFSTILKSLLSPKRAKVLLAVMNVETSCLPRGTVAFTNVPSSQSPT
jgi:hypothetical protein